MSVTSWIEMLAVHANSDKKVFVVLPTLTGNHFSSLPLILWYFRLKTNNDRLSTHRFPLASMTQKKKNWFLTIFIKLYIFCFYSKKCKKIERYLFALFQKFESKTNEIENKSSTFDGAQLVSNHLLCNKCGHFCSRCVSDRNVKVLIKMNFKIVR